jgi:hypothetical protein
MASKSQTDLINTQLNHKQNGIKITDWSNQHTIKSQTK